MKELVFLFILFLIFIPTFAQDIRIPLGTPSIRVREGIPWWLVLSIIVFIILIIYWKVIA